MALQLDAGARKERLDIRVNEIEVGPSFEEAHQVGNEPARDLSVGKPPIHDNDAAPMTHDSRHLAEGSVTDAARHLVQRERDANDIEALIGKRQRDGIGLLERDVRTSVLPTRDLQHGVRQVNANNFGRPVGERECLIAGSRGNIEHPRRWPDLREVGDVTA
ncbi:MAG TPA: hypothetical protein VIV40_23950 [Kofleriaceae bacterium]